MEERNKEERKTKERKMKDLRKKKKNERGKKKERMKERKKEKRTSLPQTVLFWTCEKYPRLKDWQIFNKAFLRLVRKLHKCVSQHFLKHYFVRKSNLLQYANSGRCQDPA
ncbi:Protein mab-21-like 3 [Manis javanica]|nr:Protein mab-21-like 3 [Manis javanica]